VTPVPGPPRFSRRPLAFRPRSRFVIFALTLAVCLAFGALASSQQTKPQEYQVKAVYLYNFGRFVEWPTPARNSPSFTICVLGQDPFGSVLDTTLAGESIDQRKLVARRIATPREAPSCQILFISVSETARVKEILAAVEKSSVLTVSDIPDFTSIGGMIQFVVTENKVRFSVNLMAAERVGLTLSSQLLKVATDVRKAPSQENVN